MKNKKGTNPDFTTVCLIMHWYITKQETMVKASMVKISTIKNCYDHNNIGNLKELVTISYDRLDQARNSPL